jgi:hypothetical protein
MAMAVRVHVEKPRATPTQLDRMLMACANAARNAAIDALRAAGYAVE